MRRQTAGALALIGLVAMTSLGSARGDPNAHGGQPFRDERHAGRQAIPGRVECALYDRGGEGVAYHDADAKNHGSGDLNPADGTYLNQFRMDEGVDISYTKFGPHADSHRRQPVQPRGAAREPALCGLDRTGQWFNVTVEVEREGEYDTSLLYTSNRGGTIALDVNGKPSTDDLQIRSTYDDHDTVAWRQWHHWASPMGSRACVCRRERSCSPCTWSAADR